TVLATQLFIGVSAVATLLMTALVSERQLAVLHAEEARAETRLAQYAERRRLERDLHDGLQQRLLALLINVGREDTSRSPRRLRDVLADVQGGLSDALEELRALA